MCAALLRYHGVWCVTLAWRIVKSWRMQAVSATFAALPVARRRSYNPLRTGCYRTAPRVLMDTRARTWVRPPQPVREPRGPAGPINGAPSHEGRDALAVQRPPLRQVQSPGPGTHGATTWHTRKRGLVLPPDWTRAPGRVEVIVQRG